MCCQFWRTGCYKKLLGRYLDYSFSEVTSGIKTLLYICCATRSSSWLKFFWSYFRSRWDRFLSYMNLLPKEKKKKTHFSRCVIFRYFVRHPMAWMCCQSWRTGCYKRATRLSRYVATRTREVRFVVSVPHSFEPCVTSFWPQTTFRYSFRKQIRVGFVFSEHLSSITRSHVGFCYQSCAQFGIDRLSLRKLYLCGTWSTMMYFVLSHVFACDDTRFMKEKKNTPNNLLCCSWIETLVATQSYFVSSTFDEQPPDADVRWVNSSSVCAYSIFTVSNSWVFCPLPGIIQN